MKIKFKILVFFSLVISSSAYCAFDFKAFSENYLKQTQFGFGLHNSFPFSTVRNDSGSKDLFAVTPALMVNARLINNKWLFLPEFDFIPFFSRPNNYKKVITRLGLIGGYFYRDNIELRGGVSFFRTTLSGDGGTAVMENGTSTATYYLPKDANESYNTTVDIGGEYSFKEHYSVRSDWNIYQIFSSDKRKISFTISGHYKF